MTTGPLVTLTASPKGANCPFGNKSVQISLSKGTCVWLSGNSGLGKTTLSTFLAGLSSRSSLMKLDIQAECQWNPSIPISERCGVLFQTTTLLDELTVAGNLCVALHSAKSEGPVESRIKALLETVGLDYARDANKRPSQLSGGMARRASLALQLAQRKRVIVLDEPFTGLDPVAATSVAKELVHLRKAYGTALLLISHEPHLAKLIMGDDQSHVVHLEVPKKAGPNKLSGAGNNKPGQLNLFGATVFQRFLDRLLDYIGWSLPLILLTFLACGLAIAMLSCDILRRIDVTERVLGIVDEEVKPLLKMVNGGEVNTFHLVAVKMKVRSMLNSTVPQAKATLYALGMAKLFVLEIGPLLTALLLCGRIGGSYAGKVATMQATSETKLLRTLGIHPQVWTLVPSLCAALIAAPFLTAVGTALALVLGSIVGPQYGIGDSASYWEQCLESTFPRLRLRSVSPLWEEANATTATTVWDAVGHNADFRTTWSDSYYDAMVEVVTYPLVFHVLKAAVYITITMFTAEICARLRPRITPRDVPAVITSSVVLSSLFVIVADWGFSQLLLLRV